MSEVIIAPEGGEEMILNMGPHHPSTHGVLRFIVRTDGEVMREAVPDVGYLHRAIEYIAERTSYEGFAPYTDRIDYISAMTCNHCWALAVEKLCDLSLPPRAEYLRVIVDEFNRIGSHLIMLGCTAMDIGAMTPFPYALREREALNDLLEELCGARLTYHYQRPGGVSFDMPPGWRDKALRLVERSSPIVDEFDRLITYNEIFVRRLRNVAAISATEAVDFGIVGPNLRASGVCADVRRDLPYSVYPRLEFDIPVGRGEMGTVGDSWDRFYLRVAEWRQSLRILQQALDQIEKTPAGEIRNVPKKLKPKGEAHARVESARGDMGCYIVGDGGTSPYRVHFRTGSFTSMGIVRAKSAGLMVADLVALIATLDVIAPEIDR